MFHLAKVLKFRSEVLHRKKVNSRVNTVVKNANLSTSNNPNLLKIKLQVVSDPLNNFTYASFACFIYSKSQNFALKVLHKKIIREIVPLLKMQISPQVVIKTI